MATHLLFVEQNGDVTHNGELLIVRYPDGDVDVVNTKLAKWRDKLHSALYDAYQSSEVWKDGDRFALQGRARYKCESFHVVQCDESLV